MIRRAIVGMALIVMSLVAVVAQTFPSRDEIPEGVAFLAELQGNAHSGATSAFWSVHGQGGRRSLAPSSALLDFSLTYRRSFKERHRLTGVFEALMETGHRPIYRLRQMGVAYEYQWLGLHLGAIDYRQPIDFSPQTSGAIVLSNNALPIPMAMIHTNGFVGIPYTSGLLSLYADFSVGRLFEQQYNRLMYPNPPEGYYTDGTLWHHKTAYLRIGNAKAAIPLTFTIGGTEAVHWGGHHIGKEMPEPTGFKNFLRIVMGKSGGSNATLSDQVNALGNHYGQYLLELAWHTPKSVWQLYHLHIFEDKSGMEWSNGADGLWGFHLHLKDRTLPISHAVAEYLTTLHQSGPFHILHFYRPNGEGRGGGNDEYYHNSEYKNGATYLGMNIGNPFLIPRGYNPYISGSGKGYRHTRVRAFHFGVGGTIQSIWHTEYEAKLSFVQSFGSFATRPKEPFHATYSYIRTKTPISSIPGMTVGLEVGLDLGNYTPRTFGGGASVAYRLPIH